MRRRLVVEWGKPLGAGREKRLAAKVSSEPRLPRRDRAVEQQQPRSTASSLGVVKWELRNRPKSGDQQCHNPIRENQMCT